MPSTLKILDSNFVLPTLPSALKPSSTSLSWSLMKPFVSGLSMVCAAVVGFATPAFAAGPAFNNLTQSQFDDAIRELSANSSFYSVSGASSLGTIFGIEAGLVAGLSGSPKINEFAKQVDANSDVGRIPHANILAAVSVPFGITGEMVFLPSISVGDFKYQQFGAALKWTANEGLPFLPFNLAVRGFITRNSMNFKQTLNNASTGNVPVDVTVTQENSQTGIQILAAPGLPLVEPYVGVGFISAKGSLGVSGTTTGTIFSFTSAQNAESQPTSTQLLLGVTANLLIVNLGAEWSRAFGTDTYNVKFGFKF